MHQARKNTTFARKVMTRSVCSALLVMGLAAGMAMQAQMAYAQESAAATARKAYSVPAGPLGNALTDFASQAGVTIQIDSAVVEGRRSQGLNGSVTVHEGFARLLSGSGMDAIERSRNIYVLRTAQMESTLPSVTVSADSGDSPSSYSKSAVSIGKGDQKLKDIPQSVSVVTRQMMDDKNIISVYDALASTTGIVIQQSPQGGQYIYSRGFQLGTVQYDGVPLIRDLYGRASNYLSSMTYIDRVEVLRGAAGLLQGEGSPAGAVNLVRKRPLHNNEFSVEARAGSWDRYGAQVDVSRVLNEEGTLRGRALIDHQDQHSYIDYANQRNTTIYGTLEYDLSPATTVNLGVSSEEVNGRPFLNGLPRFSTGVDLNLPRSTYWGASWNRQQSTNTGLYLDVSHRINDNWKFKVSGAHIKEKHDFKFAGVNGAVNPATMQSANIVTRQMADVETSGIDANLIGSFDAFGRQHELVTGANYARAKTDHTFGYRLNYNIFNINNFNPQFAEPTDASIYAANREDGNGVTSQYGAYSVLRLQIADPLKLILGARASWFDADWSTRNTVGTVSTTARNENAKITPYAGLIYALSPQWSTYVSYADTFQPQTARNEAGDVLKPIVGGNYEAGIKGELAGGRVNASFAIFRIEQANRAQVDFSTSPTCRNNYYCYSDAGEVRSEGFDAELSGEIAKNWNLFTGYTFVKTKYISDATNTGLSFSPDTPEQLFRLSTTYRLPGALSKVTIGGGVDTQSATYRQVGAIRVNIPGRAVWNALVKYDIDRNWTAALNLNNVFDKHYYRAVAGFNNGNYYGDPRNAMLTLRGRF